MSDKHKHRLRGVRDGLVNNISMASIVNILQSKGIVNSTDYEAIKAGDTEYKKVEIFLDILDKKPDSMFSMFVDILDDNHHEHVAQLLRQEDISNTPPVAPVAPGNSRNSETGRRASLVTLCFQCHIQ